MIVNVSRTVPGEISHNAQTLIKHLVHPEKASEIEAFARRVVDYRRIMEGLPAGTALLNLEYAATVTALLHSLEAGALERFSLSQAADIVSTSGLVRSGLVKTQRVVVRV
jgi:hypothetical protein